MQRTVAVLTVLLVSVATPVTAGAASADQSTYAGSHTTFETRSNAVVDYRVNGAQAFESVRVQTRSDVDSSLGLGGSADLAAVARKAGAALSLDSSTAAGASVTADSGATIEAHDNSHGTLVVAAEERSQYVALNVSGGADVSRESDQRVVFTTESGSEATAMSSARGTSASPKAGT